MGQYLNKISKEKTNRRNVSSITSRHGLRDLLSDKRYTDICLKLALFSSNVNKYTRKMDTLAYVNTCERIDAGNMNGVLYRLKSKMEGSNLVTFLKLMIDNDKDNTLYEYFVSRRVNYFTNTPNTLCILNLYKLKHSGIHDVMMNKQPKPALLQRIMKPIHRFSENIVKDSCTNWKLYAFDQLYIPNFITLDHFMLHPEERSRDEYYRTLWLVLYQVYAFLRIYMKVFTHHDLHPKNVLLVFVPNETFHFKYFDENKGKHIEFKCPYLVKIVDYGRSYCQAVTERLFKQVCEYCPKCGGSSGYQFNYFQMFSNESSDLRLLLIVGNKYRIEDNVLRNIFKIVKFDDPFDTTRMTESGLPKGAIYTVDDAYIVITQALQDAMNRYTDYMNDKKPYVSFIMSTSIVESMDDIRDNRKRLRSAYKIQY